MKVLMIDALVGNSYSELLCSGLKKVGVAISLIVPENKIVSDNPNFTILKWSPSKDPSSNKIKKIIAYFNYLALVLKFNRQVKVDIIHYQFFRRKSEMLFFVLLKFLGVKLVHTAHNVLPHERKKIDRLLHWAIYKSAAAIIVHSHFIKNLLNQSFPMTKEKTHVIPHGNFDSYISKNFITRQAARKELLITANDKVLLFFGYIKEYKGLDLLLDAFEIAAQQDKNLKLLIAGEAEPASLKNHYLYRIKNSASQDRIVAHLNFVATEEVAKYFSAADLVALPYKNIYHSGIIHLAFSFGRSVIATQVGDFEETLEKGKHGFLCEKNDALHFAELISYAFSDKKKLENIGAQVKKLSETIYSWNDIARRTLSVYEQIFCDN